MGLFNIQLIFFTFSLQYSDEYESARLACQMLLLTDYIMCISQSQCGGTKFCSHRSFIENLI